MSQSIKDSSKEGRAPLCSKLPTRRQAMGKPIHCNCLTHTPHRQPLLIRIASSNSTIENIRYKDGQMIENHHVVHKEITPWKISTNKKRSSKNRGTITNRRNFKMTTALFMEWWEDKTFKKRKQLEITNV